MKLAVMEVSGELLREMFNLPVTAKIISSVLPSQPDAVALVVESPDFAEIPEGTRRVIAPRYQNDADGNMTFVDWGLPT